MSHGSSPSIAALLFLLKSASTKRADDLHAATRLHLLVLRHGLYTRTLLADHLVRLFALCGSLPASIRSFRLAPYPSVFTWNIVISAHQKLGRDDDALRLFAEMQARGCAADGVTFSCVLKACARLGAAKRGRFAHDLVVRSGVERSTVLDSTLVDMYARCGNLREAHSMFRDMERPDVVTWGIIIAAYAEENAVLALELFDEMQGHGFLKPNIVVFSSALRACGNIKDRGRGEFLHDRIERSGLRSDVVIGSTLVDMYVKCESIREARETFDRLEVRDVVTWGAMIHGCITHEQYFDAFSLFEAMKVCGVLPNAIIFQCLVQACKALEDIKRVRMLHCQIYDPGRELDPCMSNAIVHMYCKSGSLNDACRVFCMSTSPSDSQSWDYLLSQYVEHGHFTAALGLYAKMQEEGMSPRKSTVLMHVLKACQGLGEGCFNKATVVHHHIIDHGFDLDEAARSALLTLYAKCGSIKEARNVFDTFPTPPDVVSWGAMMAGYVYQGDSLPALQLFKEMLGQGIQPSDYVLSCILKACSGLYALEQGRWIHDRVIRSGFELNVVVNSCIVDLYAKCGHLQDADDVFVNLSNRDSTSWGAMIEGYASSGEIDKAFDCFQQMQEEGVLVDKVVCSSILKASGIRRNARQGRLVCDEIIRAGIKVDVILANSIIDMFAKCGALADARKSFDLFPRKDVVSWGAMIGGYVANDESIHALKLFETMQKDGIAPNNVLYLSILKACGGTRMTWLIRFIHDQIVRNELESDRAVSNTLINMYGKCGSFVDAQKVLDNLPGADVISWASMVSGLSRDGNSSKLAQQYLKDMNTCGLTKKPEGASFINMLSACTHAGTVADGLNFFEGVTGNGGGRSSLTLMLYSCVIDLLGRTGYLKEADNLIQTMPSFPDSISWSSLLSSCKVYGNTNLGKQCFLEAGT